MSHQVVLHIEIDDIPVDFGRDDTPARGNIGLWPTSVPAEVEIAGHTVTIECVDIFEEPVGGV